MGGMPTEGLRLKDESGRLKVDRKGWAIYCPLKIVYDKMKIGFQSIATLTAILASGCDSNQYSIGKLQAVWGHQGVS